MTHDKAPSHRRASRTDARKLTEIVSDEERRESGGGSRSPGRQAGHAVCNDRHAAREKPALEGPGCVTPAEARVLSLIQTGTVHAGGPRNEDFQIVAPRHGCVNHWEWLLAMRKGLLSIESRSAQAPPGTSMPSPLAFSMPDRPPLPKNEAQAQQEHAEGIASDLAVVARTDGGGPRFLASVAVMAVAKADSLHRLSISAP
ncbi:hypothetical protein DdX_20212 [Ditylenchus destructor]|uniref:Uncharacterized protein n=1 Tax=Ditylenchus destructor TaxID=166010 RepID=A0AAD4MGK8_9BILA|nr:hypothetical protein DdX_20212 [Ditylenchus destructor]